MARIRLPGGNSRFDYASLDPVRGLLFVAHLGASQIVEINIDTGRVVRTIPGMAQVHWVLVVPALRRVYATATGANKVVRIDEETRRVPLPGCSDDHSLTLDSPARLAFVACDINDVLLTVDMNTWRVTGTANVGVEPDVLAFDPHAGRLYAASESGSVTVLQFHGRRMHVIYYGYLADDAHVVAVDPATGRSYFPALSASGGHPAVLVCVIN